MLWFASHDENGRVTRIGNAYSEEEAFAQKEEGRLISLIPAPVPVRELSEHFLKDGALCPRPVSTVSIDKSEIRTDGMDAAVISGIPEGAKLWVNGKPTTITGGTVTMRGRTAQVYELMVDEWPVMPWQARLTVKPVLSANLGVQV